jgi:molybdopterin molybdotransferase
MAKGIEVEAALREILARVRPLGVEEVDLGEALGRRLAVTAIAEAPVQGFDNSSMDGFAVRAADTASAGEATPVALTVVDESRAGRPAERGLGPGEAIAISTGAMLPAGADASVPVEDTERDGERVLVRAAVAAGENVRHAGDDIAPGQRLVEAGAELGAAELGALATIGLDPAPVHRRPRVAVVTSGDELAPSGRPLGPGEVRDSNARTVPALARLAGAEVASVTWTPDEPEATRRALEPALGADVAIVCGGVSVGEHDHVKGALADLGAEEVFWRVALKPGGPTWFGTRGDTLVFGLPGNPVSVFVTFLLLVRPALIALAGGEPGAPRTTARLGADYVKPTDRAHAVRCRLESDEHGWVAWPLPQQGSHVLTSMLAADCLALIPTASAGVAAGETVEIELLDRASMGR